MTFLESDEVSLCDLLEHEDSLFSDVKCVRRDPGEIYDIAVTSGFKAKRCILRHPGLHQPVRELKYRIWA